MLYQCIKMALKAINANRMRSFLTMLGIIVGVLSLVVLVSLVSSAGDAVTEQVEGLGTDYIRITIVDDGGVPLELDELPGFINHEAIGSMTAVNQMTVTARNGRENGIATVTGTTPSYFGITGLSLISGRFINTADVNSNTHVAVISEQTAKDLYGTADVLGKEISLAGRPFLIIGVLNNQESLTTMFSTGFTIYIPFTTAVRASETLSNGITTLFASASGTDMNAAEEAIQEMLLERFRQNPDAFSLFNQAIIVEAMGEITGMLAALLGGVAAVSLLVGGIGIMNIMLVSVTERTKEIGIRKAIGAGQGSILLQFLIEALILCLIGGLFGVLVSWGILEGVSALVGDLMSFQLSADVVWIAILFSLVIGLIFGLYPAGKAARKRPIDALRYEG